MLKIFSLRSYNKSNFWTNRSSSMIKHMRYGKFLFISSLKLFNLSRHFISLHNDLSSLMHSRNFSLNQPCLVRISLDYALQCLFLGKDMTCLCSTIIVIALGAEERRDTLLLLCLLLSTVLFYVTKMRTKYPIIYQ